LTELSKTCRVRPSTCDCTDCQQTRAVVRSWAARGYEPAPVRLRWFLIGVVAGLAVAVLLAFASPRPRTGTTTVQRAACEDTPWNPPFVPKKPDVAM